MSSLSRRPRGGRGARRWPPGWCMSVIDEDTPGASSSKKPMPRGATDPRGGSVALVRGGALVASGPRGDGHAATRRARGARGGRAGRGWSRGKWTRARRGESWKRRRWRPTRTRFSSAKGTYPNGTVMCGRVALERRARSANCARGFASVRVRSEFDERLDSRTRAIVARSGVARSRDGRRNVSVPRPKTLRVITYSEQLWATHRETARANQSASPISYFVLTGDVQQTICSFEEKIRR